MSTDLEHAAKIAKLETEVLNIGKELAKMDEKLDQLLHLKSVGQGAFWLASAIFGTGIVTAFLGFVEFLKGH